MQPDVSLLVAEFAKHVALQTDAIRRGDAKTGNRHANSYIGAFRKLRAIGDVGRDALRVLFVHERPDVRVTTAAFLLRYCTGDALKVLEAEAAKEMTLSCFQASQAIARWREGSWALDPAEGEMG